MVDARRVVLVLALLASGCFLDRTAVGVTPQSPDAGSDATVPDIDRRDAGRDAADAGGPDSGLDAGPPDAGPADAGPPSCRAQYTTEARVMHCAERATECELLVQLGGGRTCRTFCAAHGGHCITGYADIADMICVRGAEIGCDQEHGDDLCVCSRGP